MEVESYVNPYFILLLRIFLTEPSTDDRWWSQLSPWSQYLGGKLGCKGKTATIAYKLSIV